MGPFHFFWWGGGGGGGWGRRGGGTHILPVLPESSPPALKIARAPEMVYSSISVLGWGYMRSYKLHWTKYFDKQINKQSCTRTFAQILPEFCPKMPEFIPQFCPQIAQILPELGGGGCTVPPAPLSRLIHLWVIDITKFF